MTENKPLTETYGAPPSEAPTGTAGTIRSQLGAAANKAKDKVDRAREPIADTLLGAADSLRSQGERLPRSAAEVAQGAADRLEASATYLVSNTVPEMVQDLLSLVRKHPARSLLIAGALGFLLGRALRER
ncbi:MAG TPA: hypothetical protein VMF64_14450 [Steroidobacteraceae bacterium]|nr:hypothetical protein [Steroidobacteraceae bacterium]